MTVRRIAVVRQVITIEGKQEGSKQGGSGKNAV